jgi:hypothetical protein
LNSIFLVRYYLTPPMMGSIDPIGKISQAG